MDGREKLEAAEKRCYATITDVSCAANIIHPSFIGANLTTSEFRQDINWSNNRYPNSKVSIMNFIGGEKEIVKTEYDFECDLLTFIKG